MMSDASVSAYLLALIATFSLCAYLVIRSRAIRLTYRTPLQDRSIQPDQTAALAALTTAGTGLVVFGLGLLLREIISMSSSMFNGAWLGATALTCIVAIAVQISRSSLHKRSRDRADRLVRYGLMIVSGTAVLATLGIILSLIVEALLFFGEVSILDFLFGTQWSPQTAIRSEQAGQSGAFGAIPVFSGTFLITIIAMVIAGPIGLMIAIYTSEYASIRTRKIVKPTIEILAGIPTVVYGFFALLIVGPSLRGAAAWMGFDVPTQSALAAGLVMGVMIIPLVSSLSDDVISAVPQSLRNGSYALGATKSETVSRVVLKSAMPGIIGSQLLAISRAVGETMIVVMAAGRAANLTANPFESVTTVTVQIVALVTGDQEFDSAKTLAAFALGLVLFVITLLLNIAALSVVQRYQKRFQ